jgi:hypothetical protein
MAFPGKQWVSPDDLDPDYDGDDRVQVETRGLMKLRFPELQSDVKKVRQLVLTITAPLLEVDAQVTLLFDGLDRLIKPARFREFAEQDLQALRGTKISVIVVAPLLMLYDRSRFLQEYFDVVRHLPAAAGRRDKAFLRSILERRGALKLMGSVEVSSIVRYSGGVIRDLLTLASSAAANAYRDDQDQIGAEHTRAAVQQLGNRYLMGLGIAQRRRLDRLARSGQFSLEDPVALELLVNRQVLEHFENERESFKVHPALSRVLAKRTKSP